MIRQINNNFLDSVTKFLKKRTFELVGFLLIFLGFVLFISLLTYSPEDSSFVFGNNK